ncbi:MAG: DNA methyltransferase [Methanophagales archaeon]|nr:DNA methyltransferase [Methanophagales archaeon]
MLRENVVYCGDCKSVLAGFPEKSVDLIYADPPFFSNRHYEVVWGDGYELRAFEDRWKGGIENYTAWMEDRIRECHRVLKETGSFYLHCDFHANAHLRISLDRVFGRGNFRNEIIWCYTGPSNTKRYFPRKTDTIFFYVKNRDANYFFDVEKIRVPYKKLETGKTSGIFKGEATLSEKGKIPENWWEEKRDGMSPVGRLKRERLGYPTQKPEALLERILKASSSEGDLVLDPFCGCGTSIAVAHRLGRRWVGIDVSPTACKVMVRRMRSLGVSVGESEIIGLPRTVEELKTMKPFEFQNWVCEQLNGRVSSKKSGDFGIDGWLIDGRPLQVKQSENVGRNVVDNFETALRRAGRNRGVVVAFSFGKGANEETARARLQDGLEIELKTVEEILRGENYSPEVA